MSTMLYNIFNADWLLLLLSASIMFYLLSWGRKKLNSLASSKSIQRLPFQSTNDLKTQV
jgi:hypothetical protein